GCRRAARRAPRRGPAVPARRGAARRPRPSPGRRPVRGRDGGGVAAVRIDGGGVRPRGARKTRLTSGFHGSRNSADAGARRLAAPRRTRLCEDDMTETVQNTDRELKAKHRALWASGDYATVAAELIPELGSVLVEATGVRAGR